MILQVGALRFSFEYRPEKKSGSDLASQELMSINKTDLFSEKQCRYTPL